MLKQFAVIILIVVSLYLSEGLMALAPFLNAEAVVLVFGGTLLLSWSAYPLRDLVRPARPEALLFASRCALGMGALTTALSVMLVFWFPYGDGPDFYRRLAPCLAGLFYGVMLSRVILAPMAARAARQ